MKVGDLAFEPVWFDSMGAKSTCSFITTRDCSICIDPGVAAMQPSYPLSDSRKMVYKMQGLQRVRNAAERADHIVVSHYHHDHYSRDARLYRDAALWIKNPNRWINKSQWNRSREFLRLLADAYGEELTETEPGQDDFPDPYESLPAARRKDFGDYQERREELLEKWRDRFRRLTEHWQSNPWIQEPGFCRYAEDGFQDGDTTIRFKGPLFHGIEYAQTGWVTATVVETSEAKCIHSSDLQGPTIEDYADWLISEQPDILVLDGPATYLLGYMLNQTNLQRSIDNAARILKNVDPALMIWDHHLLREKAYRRRTRQVWELRDEGYAVMTAAGAKGETPVVEQTG